MSMVFSCPVILSLYGYTASDRKCAQNCLSTSHVHNFNKMSEQVFFINMSKLGKIENILSSRIN